VIERLPPHLQHIASDWKRDAKLLAEWSLLHLVNRRDVWGQYSTPTQAERLKGKKTRALTLPVPELRGKDMVTLDKLERHYGSNTRHHLIGLHAANAVGASKWFTIDIDLHDDNVVNRERLRRLNLDAAVAWWERLQDAGYDPILVDSNGVGGYHLWTLLDEPAAADDVYSFATGIVADWRDLGLDRKPEVFPKSGDASPGKLGAWLRLPGLHHTRDHFSRVWSGEAWEDDPWLDGHAAISLIMAVGSGPPPTTAPRAVVAPPAVAASPSSSSVTFCVDLDGVLAQHHPSFDLPPIGEPIPGARNFLAALRKTGRVVVHSSRTFDTLNAAAAVAEISHWLDTHKLPYDEIHASPGKPLAHAYIDDRAVVCRPQRDGGAAYSTALQAARRLAGKQEDTALQRVMHALAVLPPEGIVELAERAAELQDRDAES
jgi:hypothetical protein